MYLPSLFIILASHSYFLFFFFNDTATTEIYTLSLHDALPIYLVPDLGLTVDKNGFAVARASLCGYDNALSVALLRAAARDRKSTRLNSSHSQISYAVFCLKKKKRTY